MELNRPRVRELLNSFQLSKLFIEELGWDRLNAGLTVEVDGESFALSPIAEKRGVQIFECSSSNIPPYATRQKIDRQTRKLAHEHLIIFTDIARTTQIWQWVARQQGKPTAYREYPYYKGPTADALILRLSGIAFSISEEEGLDITGVTTALKDSLDREKVTKKFYVDFKKEHDAFMDFLKGIPLEADQRWYASVLINRLMFIYFIQAKGFLNGDVSYLRNKLEESRKKGKDRFYKEFLWPLFFKGFAERNRSKETEKLLGYIPYLNGGIFLEHQLEKLHGKNIHIPDSTFERLFDYFDRYRWQLDERPLRSQNEINPDILGYIFEKYINQKQMGAYYTKEDITEYISKNTIIPYLFDAARQKCKIAFEGEHSIWRLLQFDPDRYIYPAVKKGVELPLPEDIAAGISDVSKRTGWNKPAPEEFALPTEIWREVVARRQRYAEVKAKLAAGEVRDINDLITYNLNIRQFAQDVIEQSEGRDLLKAFWTAIENVSILDPTCGSGAFLFAALNILEPLYEACLDRMQAFVDELDRSDQKHHPEKFSDFREILARVEKHPNRRYFILKSIIIKNLYGVDIMDEAVEICKLRLFLKLVAQIEKDPAKENWGIEPLPDIDFNVRAGNTLVGFATLEEAKRIVESKFDFDKTMEKLDKKAHDLQHALDEFRRCQLDSNEAVPTEHKFELQSRIGELNSELNQYLYQVYARKKKEYIETGSHKKKDNGKQFEIWFTSHKPFHWFIEFHGIMSGGGFDVIIGNPPYVECNADSVKYSIVGYKTSECGNLYAFIMERLLALSPSTSRHGMIVPLSGHSTDRMKPLIESYYDKHGILYLMNISGDAHPSILFTGVKFRLAIFLCTRHNIKKELFCTGYLKWFAEERPTLFERVSYTAASIRPFGYLPKVSDSVHNNVMSKLMQCRSLLGLYKGDNQIYYHNAPVSWIRAHPFVPYFISERDGQKVSTQLRPVLLNSMTIAQAACGVISSTLFFIWWVSSSDCYHLNSPHVLQFPVDFSNKDSTRQLAKLSAQLSADLLRNSKRRIYFYRTSGRVEYDEFYSKLSKPLIDDIDKFLSDQYGFSAEEVDWIVNYQIKYRMGREGLEEGEE